MGVFVFVIKTLSATCDSTSPRLEETQQKTDSQTARAKEGATERNRAGRAIKGYEPRVCTSIHYVCNRVCAFMYACMCLFCMSYQHRHINSIARTRKDTRTYEKVIFCLTSGNSNL